jgi:hypothetical protein
MTDAIKDMLKMQIKQYLQMDRKSLEKLSDFINWLAEIIELPNKEMVFEKEFENQYNKILRQSINKQMSGKVGNKNIPFIQRKF